MCLAYNSFPISFHKGKNMSDFNVDFNGVKRNAEVNLDSFRKMVNYDNTKNKGYVRMALASDGKVFLQKINNKIDVPLSWRSNVKAHNNKELRELFSKVMSNDLKYVDSYFKSTINNLITLPRDGLNGPNAGKALSRVDVREVFEKFDTQFNSEWGRQNIIRNFMEHARADLGISREEVSDDDFKQNYLRLDKHGLDNFEDYFQVKEGEIKENAEERGQDKINVHEQMVKSESEFRAFIAMLETRLDVAKQYVKLTNSIQNIASRRLDNPEAVPLKLTPEEEATLRGCLKTIAIEEGFDDLDGNVDGMLGTSGEVTELFLKKIVPPFICQGIINVYNVGGQRDSDNYQQAMTENFGFDAIMEQYRNFLNGAREFLDKADKKIEITSKEMELVAQLKQATESAGGCAILLHVRDKLYQHSNMTREQAADIGSMVAELKDTFKKETEIGKYAVKYILENFAKQARHFDMTVKESGKVISDYADKVLTAAQIQFGTRQLLGENKVRNYASSNAFISKMCSELLPEAANKIKGGQYIYDKLVGRTLPAMMNHVIEEASKDNLLNREVIYTDKVGADLKADPYKSVRIKLDCLVSSYDKFREDKLATLFNRAVTAMEKHLKGMAKRYKLPDGAKIELLHLANTFSRRLKEGIEHMTDEFFSQNLDRSIDDPVLLQEYMVDELVQAFNSEREAILSEINDLANAKILSRLPGNREVEELSDAHKNVGEYLHNHPEVVQKYGQEVRDAFEHLYTSSFAKQLAGSKPKKFKLPENFAAKFRATFESDVQKFNDRYDKFATELDKKLHDIILATTKDNLDPEGLGKYGVLRKYTDLSKADKEILAQSLTFELIRGLDIKVQKMKRDFIEHPENFKKYDMRVLIEQNIINDRSSEGLFEVLTDTLQHRELNISIWMGLDKKENAQKNTEFKANLLNDTQRAINKLDMSFYYESPENVKSMGYGEIENLSRPISDALYAKMDRFVYLYGRAENTEYTQEQFNRQVADEIAAETKQAFDLYNPFRFEFMKGIPALKAKYGALTSEIMDYMILEKLENYAKDCHNLPTPKDALASMDAEMAAKEKSILEEQMAAAKAAREKRTKAYNNTMDSYQTALQSGEQRLREAGADDDDIAYFKKELNPIMRDNFSCSINLSPDEYLNDDGAEKARDVALHTIDDMVYEVELNDLKNPEKMEKLARTCGLKNFMTTETGKERVMEALRTWVNSADGIEFQKQNRKAAMTMVAYGSNREDKNKKFALDVLYDIRVSVRKNLLGFLTEQSVSRLNEKELPMAQALFQDWLKQFNLPEVKIAIVGQGNKTLNEFAMDMFNQRVADVMRQWADNPNKRLQLLDEDFIRKFLSMVNTLGLEVMLGEISREFQDGKLKEFTSSGENRQIFKAEAAGDAQANADVRQTVMLVNYRQLVKTIQKQASNASAEIAERLSSVEELSRWKDMVGEIFNRGFVSSIDQVMQVCRSRLTMLEQLPGLEAKMPELCDEAFNEFFGTNLNDFDFSKKVHKLGSPMYMRNTVRDSFSQSIVNDVTVNLTRAAQMPVSAYSTEDSTFPTDPEEGKSGSARLSAIVKERFMGYLISYRDDKKSEFSALIRQMETEIKAKH